MVSNDQLSQRLNQLETEIAHLKAAAGASTQASSTRRLSEISKFILTYLPLLTICIAVLTTIIALLVFEVDPFENYRAIKMARDLSKLYQGLGDEFIKNEEYDEADAAYQKALEFNKNNEDATKGILKAEVFNVPKDQTGYVPEVVALRLKYLTDHYKDDYQVDFLNGIFEAEQQDYENARLSFDRAIKGAIKGNHEFAAAYIARASLRLKTSDIPGAQSDFETALKFDPKNFVVNDGLGYCYLLKLDWDNAKKYLLKVTNSNNRNILDASLELSDAYLFTGNYDDALYYLQWAQRLVDTNAKADQSELAGTAIYNFMPLRDGDTDTVNRFVMVYDLEQKSAFIHYSLSLAYALKGDSAQADAELGKAKELDKLRAFNEYFASKMSSLLALTSMDDASRDWFMKNGAGLMQPDVNER